MNVSFLFDTLSTQFERLIMVFETWTTNYTCTAALMWKIRFIFFDCTQSVIKAANVCLTCSGCRLLLSANQLHLISPPNYRVTFSTINTFTTTLVSPKTARAAIAQRLSVGLVIESCWPGVRFSN